MDYRKLAAKLLEQETPRSEAFHQGLAAVLQKRVDDAPFCSPYRAGTAEDDAFFAGSMRGHNEFRNMLIEAHGNRDQVIARLQQLAGVRRAA